MSLVINVIPRFTTAAGSSLTMANWSELGIENGSFCLASLCIRPGPQVLMSFKHLRHYCAWPGKIILNLLALLAAETSSGYFKLRSPYDGSYLTISKKEVMQLLEHLQPDYVVFPDSQWLSEFSQGSVANWQSIVVGKNQLFFYWIDDCSQPIPNFLQDTSGVIWLETDRPAKDALNGIGYQAAEKINILDTIYSEDFTSLAAGCVCPTCQQGFTKAYLHHLLQNTPLLAQRFLIAHNISIMRQTFCLT